MNNTFNEWVLIFTIFSILGWTAESLFHWIRVGKAVNRGFLIGPWSPVYGLSGIYLLLVTQPLKAYPAAVFFVALFSFALLDYCLKWLLEFLFKIRWSIR